MEIQTKFFAALREIVGTKMTIVEMDAGALIQDVLHNLIKRYGEIFKRQLFDDQGKLSTSYQVLVNGINIGTLEGLETPLNDGDTIAILPPVGGG